MEIILIFISVFFIYFMMVRIDSKRARTLSYMHIPAAHRGLYTMDQSVPENSLAAFGKAVASGYAIELDVQASKDMEVFVFHDNTLLRMCGRLEVLKTMDADEIRKMKLGNTLEPIPTLRDTLKLVDGKVPLWIEIKTTEKRKETVDNVMELLRDYHGSYSICSFDPLILIQLKKHYPHVIRGIIVENFAPDKSRPWYVLIVLFFCLLNFLTRPDYQSFDVAQQHHPTYGLNRWLGAHSVFWVIRSADQELAVRKSCDNIVFEEYLPEIKPSL
jgi:glycerophosphoryl diester phosphodiesterase